LVRPGRLSHHIELYKPDLDAIKEILYYKLDINIITDDSSSSNSSSVVGGGVEDRVRQSKGIPCANDVNVDKLAEHLYRQEASCADVDGLVKAASYNTIRRHVEAAQVNLLRYFCVCVFLKNKAYINHACSFIFIFTDCRKNC
jgi:SpoVK/Ycf46/Vps4 family AAA+-type ATPase